MVADRTGFPGASVYGKLLRLAHQLPTISDDAPELRNYVIRKMLLLGQKIWQGSPEYRNTLWIGNASSSADGRCESGHKAYLEAAAAERKRENERGRFSNNPRTVPFYDEACELITGKPPS